MASILEKTRFLITHELNLDNFVLFCDIIKALKKIAQKKAMSEITLDETQLKELLKAAIFELVKEHKEVFSEIVTEALEDIGMENAIKEGENTETVSRDRIFKLLKRQHSKLAVLLESFRTDELSLETVAQEVEAVRSEIHARKTNH